jgi:tetratricopeptide (TPR) repeat protein
LQKKTLPEDHLSIGNTFNNLGLIYSNLNEYYGATSYYEQALEIYKKKLPENDSSIPEIFISLGNVYKSLGKTKKGKFCSNENYYKKAIYHHNGKRYEYIAAAYYYEQALEKYKKVSTENDSSIVCILGSLGSVYKSFAKSYILIGDFYESERYYEKAKYSYEQALEIYRKKFPENYAAISDTLNSLGRVYKGLGQSKKDRFYDNKEKEDYEKKIFYMKAIDYYEEALEICKKESPENHSSIAKILKRLASLYKELGEFDNDYYEKAMLFREQASEIYRKTSSDKQLEKWDSLNRDDLRPSFQERLLNNCILL